MNLDNNSMVDEIDNIMKEIFITTKEVLKTTSNTKAISELSNLIEKVNKCNEIAINQSPQQPISSPVTVKENTVKTTNITVKPNVQQTIIDPPKFYRDLCSKLYSAVISNKLKESTDLVKLLIKDAQDMVDSSPSNSNKDLVIDLIPKLLSSLKLSLSSKVFFYFF